MSKQWGHGYYKGLAEAQSEKSTMVGLFFHSCHDGDLGYQGKIIKAINDNTFLAQLYDWVLGSPASCKTFHLEEMKDWRFYETAQAMDDAANLHWDRQGMKPRCPGL